MKIVDNQLSIKRFQNISLSLTGHIWAYYIQYIIDGIFVLTYNKKQRSKDVYSERDLDSELSIFSNSVPVSLARLQSIMFWVVDSLMMRKYKTTKSMEDSCDSGPGLPRSGSLPFIADDESQVRSWTKNVP